MRGFGWFRSHVLLVIGGVAWLGTVASGFAILHRYEITPGSASAPTLVWPTGTAIPLETNQLTIVLALHPRCACSAATVDELERVLATRAGRGKLNVLLFKPAGKPDGWTSSSTSRALGQLADTKTWIDMGGQEAAKFGAVTSGTLLVYDSGGRLRFTGGVTPRRGLSGANAGSDALAALLDDNLLELRQTPVYGCSLFSAPNRSEGDPKCPREKKIALLPTAL